MWQNLVTFVITTKQKGEIEMASAVTLLKKFANVNHGVLDFCSL